MPIRMPVEFIVEEERIEKVFRLKNGVSIYVLDGNKFVLKPRAYLESWMLKKVNSTVIRELAKEEFEEIIERIKGERV